VRAARAVRLVPSDRVAWRLALVAPPPAARPTVARSTRPLVSILRRDRALSQRAPPRDARGRRQEAGGAARRPRASGHGPRRAPASVGRRAAAATPTPTTTTRTSRPRSRRSRSRALCRPARSKPMATPRRRAALAVLAKAVVSNASCSRRAMAHACPEVSSSASSYRSRSSSPSRSAFTTASLAAVKAASVERKRVSRARRTTVDPTAATSPEVTATTSCPVGNRIKARS
jgi:hypothetical protein